MAYKELSSADQKVLQSYAESLIDETATVKRSSNIQADLSSNLVTLQQMRRREALVEAHPNIIFPGDEARCRDLADGCVSRIQTNIRMASRDDFGEKPNAVAAQLNNIVEAVLRPGSLADALGADKNVPSLARAVFQDKPILRKEELGTDMVIKDYAQALLNKALEAAIEPLISARNGLRRDLKTLARIRRYKALSEKMPKILPPLNAGNKIVEDACVANIQGYVRLASSANHGSMAKTGAEAQLQVVRDLLSDAVKPGALLDPNLRGIAKEVMAPHLAGKPLLQLEELGRQFTKGNTVEGVLAKLKDVSGRDGKMWLDERFPLNGQRAARTFSPTARVGVNGGHYSCN